MAREIQLIDVKGASGRMFRVASLTEAWSLIKIFKLKFPGKYDGYTLPALSSQYTRYKFQYIIFTKAGHVLFAENRNTAVYRQYLGTLSTTDVFLKHHLFDMDIHAGFMQAMDELETKLKQDGRL